MAFVKQEIALTHLEHPRTGMLPMTSTPRGVEQSGVLLIQDTYGEQLPTCLEDGICRFKINLIFTR